MTSLHHRRTQFPVGEGLFHAGLLSSPSGERLTYVYDCGSQLRYGPRARDAIADYRSRLDTEPLDLLFLSHAHADHVNGVPELLDDLEVGTVVIPLLSVYERLVAFARSLDTEPETPGGFFEDWVVDPVAAVVEQGASRVVVVRPTTPGAVPPINDLGSDPDPETDPVPDPEPDWDPEREPMDWEDPVEASNDLERVRRARPWDFVGPGAVTIRRGSGPGTDTAVIEIPDTIGIRRRLGPDAPSSFAPHVSPALFKKRGKFLAALARTIGTTTRNIESDLRDPDVVRHLVVDKPRELLAAYRLVRSDVNLTSLSLYSGPHGFAERAYCWTARATPDSETLWTGVVRGWLGTGDAKLSTRQYRRALLQHMYPLLRNVQTATLAHHGADNGFSDELLTQIPAYFWVAPAAPYHGWKHPHPDVERAVEHAGRQIVHVDGDARSVFEEDFRLPGPGMNL